METVHKVSASSLKKGIAVERAEHPTLSRTVVRQVATDHLVRNPNAYSNPDKGGEREIVVVLNQNVKAMPPRKKKKLPPREPQSSGPGWIPGNLRMWG